MGNPGTARAALRILGAINAMFAVTGIVSAWQSHELRSSITTTLGAPSDPQAAFDRYRRVAELLNLAHLAGVTLTLVALIMLVVARPRVRSFAIAALSCASVHVATVIFAMLAKLTGEPSTALRIVWFVNPILGFAAYAFAALAVARHKIIAAACAVAGLAVLLPLVLARMKDPGENAFNAMMMGYVVGHVLFAIASFVVARHVDATPSIVLAGDGAPLRLLGWSYVTRVVAGIGFAILTVSSLKAGDGEMAPLLTWFAGLVSVGCTMAALLALGQLARRSELSGGLSLAMVTIVLSLIVEIWSAVAASELITLVAEAKKATSFWGVPSFSKLEALQDTVRTATVIQVVAAMVITLSLTTAFRATARAIAAPDVADRTTGVLILALLAGPTALLTGYLMTRKKPGEEVIVFGLVAVVLGLALVVSWMKLIFGLAEALDRAKRDHAMDSAQA